MRGLAAIAWIAFAAVAAGVVSAPRAEDRGPVTRHALWKIEDGRKPVYLLGSIHILRRQNYPLERPIEDAFDAARVVAFELDLDEARAAIDKVKAVDRPAPPARKSLRSQVSPATYRSVVRYLDDAGYPNTIFDRLPAPVVAGALVQMELVRLGFDAQWGVDAYFYRRARKYGKTVVPLETVDEQAEVLAGLSARGNDEIVQAALQDAAGLRAMLRDLIRAWKGGEVEQLVHLVNGSFEDRPEVYQRVLVDRNARWVPKIEALMAGDAPALVVVGTGHLVGSDSVVAMLEARGHTVRQQ
jgi:uncharacterized protein YbaP (TraB family)